MRVHPAHTRVGSYPARVLSVAVGATRVRLLAVSDLADYVDSATLLSDPSAPEPPYWAHLWTGSRALARQVVASTACAGQRVLDIGCGLGLVGVAAALRGATVVAMDTAFAALRFVTASAQLNGCEVYPVQTDLRAPGVRGFFDLCFAADVTYEPVLQVALADFLAAHLAPAGRAWCAESVRTFDRAFHDRCRSRGLAVAEQEVREPEDGRDVRVRLTVVRRSGYPA
jgi:predicted nicotinamide N-methyase